MKKLTRLLALCLLVVYALTGCSSSPHPGGDTPPSAILESNYNNSDAKIVLLSNKTNEETLMEKAVWNAISLFAGEAGSTCSHYRADTEEMLPTLDLAVKSGAQLVVLVGGEMDAMMQKAQAKYPKVDFILVDAADSEAPAKNGASIRFSAEQAGWLAGYAVVANGSGKLAFLESGLATDRRYALGFLMGADAAARQASRIVEARVVYVLGEEARAETASEWEERLSEILKNGTEVVLGNVRVLQDRVLQLARRERAGMVAVTGEVQLPQRALLSTIIYNPNIALNGILAQWKAGEFPGGEVWEAGIEDGSISLQMQGSEFEAFTSEHYEEMMSLFKNESVADKIETICLPDEEGMPPLPEGLWFENLMVLRPLPSGSISSSQSENNEGSGNTHPSSDGAAASSEVASSSQSSAPSAPTSDSMATEPDFSGV